jgi:putative acyl-CoA dehydrogenase
VLAGGRPIAETDARRVVERLALNLQAGVLRQVGSPVADAFHRSRVAAPHMLAFGTLPADIDAGAILARAL